MLRAQATKVKAHVELLHERKLCFDTVLQVFHIPSHCMSMYSYRCFDTVLQVFSHTLTLLEQHVCV